jgi:hypothetical protein
VPGHPDRLQRRRAVPVDGHAGKIQAGEDAADPGDVVARLAARLATADDRVLDQGRIQLGHPIDHRVHDRCGEVVGPDVDQ